MFGKKKKKLHVHYIENYANLDFSRYKRKNHINEYHQIL